MTTDSGLIILYIVLYFNAWTSHNDRRLGINYSVLLLFQFSYMSSLRARSKHTPLVYSVVVQWQIHVTSGGLNLHILKEFVICPKYGGNKQILAPFSLFPDFICFLTSLWFFTPDCSLQKTKKKK